MQFTRADFPQGFVWGASTSAYQIEGHAHGGAGRTHWDDFAATPGNVVRAEHGAVACDHYHRMDADLDLLAELGVDAYRFSTSWARVLPEGRGTPNDEGLDFYDRLVDGLLERGIKPAVTLYHWELPSALADLGGWRNGDVADWFADYAEMIMGRIGDRAWSVAPINEPWCVAWLSHFVGAHAPGVRDIRAAARAMHHVGVAHGRAIQAMRAMGLKNLGAVCNFEYAEPASDAEADVAAAARYDAIYNRWFLGGMFRGEYPALALEGLEAHLPANWQDDMATVSAPLDWLGVNHYTRQRTRAAPGPWPALEAADPVLPTTQMGWEVYPEGLRHFLHLAHEHAAGLPIYVTENGMANDDALVDGTVHDAARVDYLNAYVAEARRAMEGGVPLAGYFVWSLMDNYEWALGYEKRFGLVHVDFETLERTPKASFHALAKALR